jgi:hypothetical protein
MGTGVVVAVQHAVLSVWQPLASSAHKASADAPATREFNLVFIISRLNLCSKREKSTSRTPSRRAEALAGG